MRFILLTVCVCLSVLSSSGQNQIKSLSKALETVKSQKQIVVEGYYVDSSSFMVLSSSDASIRENVRYPIFESKFKLLLHAKTPESKVEIPVLMRPETQGKKRPRILFVNLATSNNSQLIVKEGEQEGWSIIDDRVEYIDTKSGVADTVDVVVLRDLCFSR